MKRLAMAATLTILSFGTAIADHDKVTVMQNPWKENYPYAGVHGGLSIPSGSNGFNQLNVGADVGGQVGYQIGNLRLEAAATYLSNSLKNLNDTTFKMTTVMANIYYDFHFGNTLVPYVGGGAGWAHAWVTSNYDYNSNFVSPDANEFAYQAIFGVKFRLGTRTLLDFGYHRLSWTDGNGAQNLIEVALNYAIGM